eukprot:6094_1
MTPVLLLILFLIESSSSSPYNCSVMVGANMTWMQTIDDKTVTGGYNYYWPNGTIHVHNLEGNIQLIGRYEIHDEDGADLCYEKEIYDWPKNATSMCSSFYVDNSKERRALGFGYITETGCSVIGTDCQFIKNCTGKLKYWFIANLVNYL